MASKCRSKNEFYNVLSRDGNVYLLLPKIKTKSIWGLSWQLEEKKLTWDKATVIKVPQYEGLTVKDILKFSQLHIIYLITPSYNYDKELNREWICNIVNSLIPSEFREFIEKKVDDRKENIIKSQNLRVIILHQFVSIFKVSNSVSLNKGRSHFLIRTPN